MLASSIQHLSSSPINIYAHVCRVLRLHFLHVHVSMPYNKGTSTHVPFRPLDAVDKLFFFLFETLVRGKINYKSIQVLFREN